MAAFMTSNCQDALRPSVYCKPNLRLIFEGILYRVRTGIGMSRGGMTSKIHLAVDVSGNPVEIIITAGNINDISVAPELSL
jgi:hypothetical protein